MECVRHATGNGRSQESFPPAIVTLRFAPCATTRERVHGTTMACEIRPPQLQQLQTPQLDSKHSCGVLRGISALLEIFFVNLAQQADIQRYRTPEFSTTTMGPNTTLSSVSTPVRVSVHVADPSN